jgi:hypothetical protein
MPDIRNIPEVKIEELDQLEEKENKELETKVEETLKNKNETRETTGTSKTKENESAQEEQEQTQDIDWKKKFQESQREALALHASVKEKEEKIEELSRPKEISDNELKEKYPEWEEMSEREQKLAREAENTKIRLTNIEAQNSIYHNEKRWSQKIDEQVKEWETLEQFPRITEKKEEFKRFCQKPTHKNIDLETLAKAFLFEVKDSPKKKASTPMTMKKDKGNQVPQKKKWTAEEVMSLRENYPRKYQELVIRGVFDDLEID